VPVLIDVPAGAVGDVIDEAELLRLRRTYAGTVTLVDRWLGTLFDALKRLGRMDDTMVVFTADQGEPLGEHGYVRRFRPWLYEELVHTPLIVRMPRGAYGGGRHQALVQTVDLLPTLLAALGLPPGGHVQGHDLLPLIRGEQSKVRDYACLGMDVEEFAIRTHLWHLIVPIEIDPDDPPRRPELYRKPEDRWDQNDVADQFPEVAEHLELTLRRFVGAVGRDAIDTLPPLREIARFALS
jgi:arylsulfatase A-like enzyme